MHDMITITATKYQLAFTKFPVVKILNKAIVARSHYNRGSHIQTAVPSSECCVITSYSRRKKANLNCWTGRRRCGREVVIDISCVTFTVIVPGPTDTE